MPTYDYVCEACSHRLEVIHAFSAEGPRECPNCHSHALRKVFAAPAIVFRGSGWAKKDRSSGSTTKAAAKSAAGDGSDGSGRGSRGEESSDKSRDRSGDTSGEKSGDKSGSDSAAKTGSGSAGGASGDRTESRSGAAAD
jgi:putative FmdB family regulatory protein